MRNIIFTADDYGALDCIDDGIIEAVQTSGTINSVAALANGPDAISRLQRLQAECPEVQIGCHLTLTSGKTVSPRDQVKSLVDRNGQFNLFDEFQFRMKKDEVREELIAQLNVFAEAGIEIKHISSHHGSLDYFEKFHQILIEVANTYASAPIPVRSPIIEPELKRWAYHSKVQLNLIDDMNLRQYGLLRDFQKTTSSRSELRKLMKKYGYPDTQSPAYLDNTHISIPKEGIMPLFKINRKAKRRRGNLLDEVSDLEHNNKTVEFVFHLMHDNYKNLSKYMNQAKTYSGVNPKYFDGRLVEQRSIKGVDVQKLTNRQAQLVKWSEV